MNIDGIMYLFFMAGGSFFTLGTIYIGAAMLHVAHVTLKKVEK